MNKILLSIIFIVVAVILAAAIYSFNSPLQLQPQQQDFAFTVNGNNSCLRFLDREVKTIYIPFRTGANEKWQLSIDCTIPGGAGAWTDLYTYRGFWDEGSEHICVSEQLYPIINEIETTGSRIQANSTFTQVFGEPTAQSFTFFIIFPAGGQSTFNVKLNKVS